MQASSGKSNTISIHQSAVAALISKTELQKGHVEGLLRGARDVSGEQLPHSK